MAIDEFVDVLPAALWPQGDIRDPLGVWGFRLGVTGDATGGEIKVTARAPAGLSAAYLYTCYSVNIVQLAGTLAIASLVARLLTNWPNVDPIAGVQAYSSYLKTNMVGADAFTAPKGGSDTPLIQQQDRFLLLFDPRPSAGPLNLIELKMSNNVDTLTYSFEGYGYFWDRSVLQAPGGPRHPGAS